MTKNPMVNYAEEIKKDSETMLDKHNVLPMYKEMTVEERQAISTADRLPYDVCLLNLTGDLNVSTIIRSAHLLGAEKVWVVGRRKVDARGLVGAENYISVDKVGGLKDDGLTIDEETFLTVISSDENYMPVFVETGGETLGSFSWENILNTNPKNPENSRYYRPLLILGNEGRGIGDNILDLRDKLERSITVGIPQRGVMRSLNVASAGAIIMWDLISNMEGYW